MPTLKFSLKAPTSSFNIFSYIFSNSFLSPQSLMPTSDICSSQPKISCSLDSPSFIFFKIEFLENSLENYFFFTGSLLVGLIFKNLISNYLSQLLFKVLNINNEQISICNIVKYKYQHRTNFYT